MKWKPIFMRLLYSYCFFLFFCIYTRSQTTINTENFTVKEGLSENVVHCLLQDKKGFLWIGTHEGLNRYDGYEFKKYLHNRNDSTSLPNSPVEDLYEDGKDNLLIQTTSAFTKMNMRTGKFGSIAGPINGLKNLIDQISGGKIDKTKLGVDPVWVYNNNPDFSAEPLKKFFSDPNSLAFYYDDFKRLWVLKSDKLLVIDKTGDEKLILNNISINKSNLLFKWLINDSNGNIWLRALGKMFCIDKKTLELKMIMEQSQIKELSIDNINCILLDRSGVLWIGSFYGLKKINIASQKFKHIVATNNGKGLFSDFVLGINIYAGNKMTVQHHFVDSFYSEVELPSLVVKRQTRNANKQVEDLLEKVLIRNVERANAANRNSQIRAFKSRNYNWKEFRYAYTDREGVIWSYDNAGSLVNYHDDRKILLNDGLEFLSDDKGHLWIATTRSGLIRYDKSSGGVKKYMAAKNNSALSSNELLCLAADAKENLWIGTRGGGLNYFDKEKETFIHYTQADGLRNNTIYCMIMDNDNNLWMGTANGLSYFNTSTKSFTNFYNSDGLANTEYNRWSAVNDVEGNLYIGGMHGIDYFKPADVLQQLNNDLSIQLTDFKTGNNSQPLHNNISLHYKQNYISFGFAAMDFRNPNATQYKYMLEGSKSEWIENGHNHTATFAALPPGKYVFKVKATIQNGIWSDETVFPFTIETPWWKTKWFYLLCGLLIGGVLYGLYRFRISQLQKLYSIRTKISQDLHDEVGATLTSISFLSEVASNQNQTGDKAAGQTLHKIGDYSRDMIGEMNDIVWAINPTNDKFEKITDRIRDFASPLLAAKNIHFDFKEDMQLRSVSLNMQQRKNLYLIFKEAVNNAVKYADCNNLKVNLSRENGHIRLDIIDNGNGFVESEIIAGNGLTSIRNRAKEVHADINISSQKGNGTSISLIMPITKNA